jgi:hypothetical protein
MLGLAQKIFFKPNLFPYKHPTLPTAVTLHTYPPMKMEQTECSKILAFKLQTSVNHPEESVQHSEDGESLKSRNVYTAIISAHFHHALTTDVINIH